jgi:NAD(P)-dependent dehydrogenase (short-subunit alcohol dehydrogenase family)
MVALAEIHRSNARIATAIQPLVGVFVGATSGIGETALREFVRLGGSCRVYFVGRSQESGNRILAELKELNKQADVKFIQADVGLMKKVDEVSERIREQEKYINVLFLSQGTAQFKTSELHALCERPEMTAQLTTPAQPETTEDIHLFMAVTYYSRTRFALNLLPQLRAAPHLRRVVTVMAGGKEGQVFPADWDGWSVPLTKGRGHLCSMLTMSLQHLARQAPEVSFVHDYPGFVKTNLIRPETGLLVNAVVWLLKPFQFRHTYVPLRECGERHVYLATSARYPPKEGEVAGVALKKGEKVITGADGVVGSGAYTVDDECDSAASKEVVDLLARYRKEGLDRQLWEHTEKTFVRTTGKVSL